MDWKPVCDIIVTLLLAGASISAVMLYRLIKGRLTVCFAAGFIYMAVLRGITMSGMNLFSFEPSLTRALTLPSYMLLFAGIFGLYARIKEILK